MHNIWVPVEATWEINTLGIVRNRKTRRVLKLRLRKDGYLDVKLSYRRHLVHRLVALAFLANPMALPQVNHKDGNRSNPSASNLEWCSQIHNMQHAVKTGLFPSRIGEANGRATITAVVAKSIKKWLALGQHPNFIAEQLSVSVYVVQNIKRGLTWKNV